MQPLEVKVQQAGTISELGENISYSLSLGLEELNLGLVRHDGTAVIVGSGPSIKEFVEDIRAEKERGRTILAVKGAYDYLVENGITPDLYLSVEPRDRPIHHPQEETIFLLASRCSPKVFDRLKGHKIILWHTWGDEDENEFIKDKMSFGGGTTSGLRALNVMYCQGFRNFHLYGFDSCLVNGEKRIDQGTIHQDVKTIEVFLGGRTFICNMGMAQQANEFQNIYDVMPDIHVESFGDGLISTILEERKKNGFKT